MADYYGNLDDYTSALYPVLMGEDLDLRRYNKIA